MVVNSLPDSAISGPGDRKKQLETRSSEKQSPPCNAFSPYSTDSNGTHGRVFPGLSLCSRPSSTGNLGSLAGTNGSGLGNGPRNTLATSSSTTNLAFYRTRLPGSTGSLPRPSSGSNLQNAVKSCSSGGNLVILDGRGSPGSAGGLNGLNYLDHSGRNTVSLSGRDSPVLDERGSPNFAGFVSPPPPESGGKTDDAPCRVVTTPTGKTLVTTPLENGKPVSSAKDQRNDTGAKQSTSVFDSNGEVLLFHEPWRTELLLPPDVVENAFGKRNSSFRALFYAKWVLILVHCFGVYLACGWVAGANRVNTCVGNSNSSRYLMISELSSALEPSFLVFPITAAAFLA